MTANDEQIADEIVAEAERLGIRCEQRRDESKLDPEHDCFFSFHSQAFNRRFQKLINGESFVESSVTGTVVEMLTALLPATLEKLKQIPTPVIESSPYGNFLHPGEDWMCLASKQHQIDEHEKFGSRLLARLSPNEPPVDLTPEAKAEAIKAAVLKLTEVTEEKWDRELLRHRTWWVKQALIAY